MPEAQALFVVLRLDDGQERKVRRRRLSLVARGPDPVPAACSPPAPEAACCAPPKPPAWTGDRRAGAVYLSRQVDGRYAASLVLPDGAGHRQVAHVRDVPPSELADELAAMARRLARLSIEPA